MDLESSPFYHLLDTNHATSCAEAKHIREFLRLPEQELRDIDEEIARLHTRKEKLSSYIHKHRQLLSPIRRFPPEMIAELFTYCLPSTYPPTRDPSEAPLLLTLVCKQWREIALCTPYLWSALHIYIPYSRVQDKGFMEIRKNRIKQWLERSGNLPLSLSLTHRKSDWEWTRQGSDNQELLISSLMECFIEYSSRWKDLTLNAPDTVFQLIGAVPPEKLRALQRLSINVPYSYYHPTPSREFEESLFAFLNRLPRLTSLHLRKHSLLPFQSGSQQWSKLTELSLLPSLDRYGRDDDPLLFNDVMRLLSQTPDLRVCKLMIKVDVTAIEHRVTLPLLHDLTFVFCTHGEPSLTLAQSLTAPSLANLTISTLTKYGHVDGTFSRGLLLKLFKESTFIQSLHIGIITAIALPLYDLFHLVPRLKSLTISYETDRDQTQKLIRMLSGSPAVVDKSSPEPESSLPLFPELQTLKLLDVGSDNCLTPSDLLNLIRSRQEYSSLYSSQNSDPDSRKCHALRTLEVYFTGWCDRKDVTPEIMEAFERLREEGMDICIAYSEWREEPEPEPEWNDDLPWEGLYDWEGLSEWEINRSSRMIKTKPENAEMVYI
ncbi:hypothetical protein K435DRAFT_779985 [Dendrothele bispora CBS 962.96]|uniref:Uncharacterized protein n=1 Tax=Dendrothele bispora (strain CBS 962.96) TaxID=1314807 RepID=A0A4S8LU75_DENBC|nr:hypothetical protein K435DRAFT_779985 [Dendrothele bispora CBS 962.96]